MVKSEPRQDAEILVRNPSPRLFGEKFRDSKKVKSNHEKTRLRDLSETLPRFRDPAKIFRDPRFSRLNYFLALQNYTLFWQSVFSLTDCTWHDVTLNITFTQAPASCKSDFLAKFALTPHFFD